MLKLTVERVLVGNLYPLAWLAKEKDISIVMSRETKKQHDFWICQPLGMWSGRSLGKPDRTAKESLEPCIQIPDASGLLFGRQRAICRMKLI